MTEPASEAPLVDFNPSGRRPAGHSIAELNRIRDAHRSVRSSHGPAGFWVLTRYADIVTALQDPGLFSSSAITVLEPSPKYRWIPEMLDPPEHTVWRRLLRPLFTPARARAMRDRIRAHCASLVEGLAPMGGCEFVADFARQYPTTIFLELLGLPTDQLPRFLEWEYAILHQPEHPQRTTARRDALREVTACFADLVEQRRHTPRDDIVTAALGFEIDGRAVTAEELIGLLTLLFIAGLDTVAAALSYMFWHLAGHPSDRERIVGDPAVIPNAVEELLRAYTIVLTARKVTSDGRVAGCPMRQGDMVLLPLPAANQDPDVFADPQTVDFDRSENRHIAFGAGPHRCLGAHLAREELRIALEEWHKVVPEYQIPKGFQSREHADQVLGIDELRLVWDRSLA